jgi:hypothetical protein
MAPCEGATWLRLFQFHDIGNGNREAAPVGRFFFEMLSSEPSERIEFGAPIILGGFPFGGYPALLLELVQGGIERAVADLQHISRNLFETKANGIAVEGAEEREFSEAASPKSPGLDQTVCSCPLLGYRAKIHPLLSVSKGKIGESSTEHVSCEDRVRVA